MEEAVLFLLCFVISEYITATVEGIRDPRESIQNEREFGGVQWEVPRQIVVDGTLTPNDREDAGRTTES